MLGAWKCLNAWGLEVFECLVPRSVVFECLVPGSV